MATPLLLLTPMATPLLLSRPLWLHPFSCLVSHGYTPSAVSPPWLHPFCCLVPHSYTPSGGNKGEVNARLQYINLACLIYTTGHQKNLLLYCACAERDLGAQNACLVRWAEHDLGRKKAVLLVGGAPTQSGCVFLD